MVNHQRVQAINQTNNINLNQMQQASQVYAEPGLSDKVGGQQGYEPGDKGAPVNQVVQQQVQSQQQIEKRQALQEKKQQDLQKRQVREQQARAQQARAQQASQQNQLQRLRQQEQQLREQIQKTQQQTQQQVQSTEPKSTMFSKYFIQTCFIIAVVAGIVLFYLNKKGLLGKSEAPVPIRAARPTTIPAATGGNINQMFKYLFNL